MKALAGFQLRLLYQISGMILSLSILSGCSVAPWERGNLAKRDMSLNPNPSLSALRAHVFDSKEASSGGYGGSGSGCGCN